MSLALSKGFESPSQGQIPSTCVVAEIRVLNKLLDNNAANADNFSQEVGHAINDTGTMRHTEILKGDVKSVAPSKCFQDGKTKYDIGYEDVKPLEVGYDIPAAKPAIPITTP